MRVRAIVARPIAANRAPQRERFKNFGKRTDI